MNRKAPTVYSWLVEQTESLSLLNKQNLIHMFYLLGGLSGYYPEEIRQHPKVLDIIDSDFPEFNELLALPDSEEHILPFIDWQTESWKYDPVKRIAVEN